MECIVDAESGGALIDAGTHRDNLLEWCQELPSGALQPWSILYEDCACCALHEISDLCGKLQAIDPLLDVDQKGADATLLVLVPVRGHLVGNHHQRRRTTTAPEIFSADPIAVGRRECCHLSEKAFRGFDVPIHRLRLSTRHTRLHESVPFPAKVSRLRNGSIMSLLGAERNSQRAGAGETVRESFEPGSRIIWTARCIAFRSLSKASIASASRKGTQRASSTS
jgi:hypothetical protein